MSEGLELEICVNPSLELTTCALCGSVLEWLSAGGLLWDGPAPLGYLCARCLMTGPRPAASRVWERARTLHDLVEHAQSDLPGDQWLIVSQAVQHQAARWESLAERLQRLGWWELKEADPPADAGT
jgi:hypothetical protein